MTAPINSIRKYCMKYGLGKTAALLPSEESTSNVNLEKLFRQTEAKKVDPMKSLGIVFKRKAEREEQRKRIRDMEVCEPAPPRKSRKTEESRKNKRISDIVPCEEIPEGFLTMLDELGLDRNGAQNHYANESLKGQWKFIEKATKIYCTEPGSVAILC